MKPILILQYNEPVKAGTIIDYLEQQNITYDLLYTPDLTELPTLAEYAAVISLGAIQSANDYQDHPHLILTYRYFEEIAKSDFPFFGICFSSQLMAKVLGASVRVNETKEFGATKIALTDSGKADSLFEGCEELLDVIEWHNDTFAMPDNATHLASNDACCNQSFRFGQLVGVQFHPEVNRELLKRWCTLAMFELVATSQTRESMLADFDKIAEAVRALNYRLLENFIKSIPATG